MAAMDTKDYFKTKRKSILTTIIKDDKFESLFLFAFFPNQHETEIYNVLCDALLSFEDANYKRDEVLSFLNNTLGMSSQLIDNAHQNLLKKQITIIQKIQIITIIL
jgi:hypothetical protein